MPAGSQDLSFDPDALREKYARERDLRLRPDGIDQYVEIAGQFASFGDDPWADPDFTREPIADDVDVAIVGAGFGGLLTAARLRELGVDNLRLIDKAADVGGTWYFNRYPGLACDVESYVYMPLLEETGYIPTEKYAKGPEIFEHCRASPKQYDLYRDACLQTEVHEIGWDETDSRWVVSHQSRRRDPGAVRVDGQRLSQQAQAARHPGYHGVPRSHLPHQSLGLRLHRRTTSSNLADKRVGIIGTGATAIQCVPHLARVGAAAVRFSADTLVGGRPRESVRPTRSGPQHSRPAGSVSASRTSSY